MSALQSPNFRRYFAGQAVSVVGTWMQKMTQAWVVLELSGSATLVGITAAFQHLPTLLAGPLGGVVVDRMNKHRLLMWTQGAAGLLALILAALTLSGLLRVWMVMLLAAALGTIHTIDKPARYGLVMEMVQAKDLTNAVALNNVIINSGMFIGPAIAGIFIELFGSGFSFLANGLSYVAALVALGAIRTGRLIPSQPVARAPGQVREGLRYLRTDPMLLATVILSAVAGLFAFEWSVTLPALVHESYDGQAGAFGAMYSAMGLGAVVGGLSIAARARPSMTYVVRSCQVLGVMIIGFAATRSLPLALAVLGIVGASSITFRSVATSLLQIRSEPQMRGRVISLMVFGTAGMRPIGAPIQGWLCDTYGARFTIVLGGALLLLASLVIALMFRRMAKRVATHERGSDVPGPAGDTH